APCARLWTRRGSPGGGAPPAEAANVSFRRCFMRGRNLHGSLILATTAMVAALAVAVSGGDAANPQHFLLTFSVPTTNDDFCATGGTIQDVFAGHANVWLDPNQPFGNRNIGESDDVFTNPENGASVTIHAAYQFTGAEISGDPTGIHTEEWTFKGAGQVIRFTNGGVLSHDTGYLVV